MCELFTSSIYILLSGEYCFRWEEIQSISALPGDPTFDQFNNKYDVASYKRICNEFGVNPSSDFRYTTGGNHGLGSVYIWVSGHGPSKTYQPVTPVSR